MEQVTGLGRGSGGEQDANLLPGTVGVAAMAGEDGVRGGDFASEIGVAGSEQVAQDLVRLLPAAVDDQVAKPGQAGRDSGTEGASGPV